MSTDVVPISASPTLATLCTAGVLSAADIHLATMVCRLCHESEESVRLALALTSRELRQGSVFLNPRTIRETILTQLDDPALRGLMDEQTAAAIEQVEQMTWPDPDHWMLTLQRSPAIADRRSAPNARPARLDSDRLYLERYWLDEQTVATRLAHLAHEKTSITDEQCRQVLDEVQETIQRPHFQLDEFQVDAVRAAATHNVSVLSGGPGTGKTTMVCIILAVLANADPHLGRIALSAPSGKAASRLRDAVTNTSHALGLKPLPTASQATTVHSLLGWQGPGGGFRYDTINQLPYDVIVVDEASMLSVSLMARLLEAIGPRTRLILVGDPDQLVSVEAGSVLPDIVASHGELGKEDDGSKDGELAREVLPVSKLTHNHRSGGAIAALAEAVQYEEHEKTLDDAVNEALEILTTNPDQISFIDADPAETPLSSLPELQETIISTAEAVRQKAAAGADDEALMLADGHRLLCAHRLGPYGVASWSAQMVETLSLTLPGLGQGQWVVGETTMVTHNMRQFEVNNGDCGVIVETSPVPTVALPGKGNSSRRLPCSLLSTMFPLQAMTVHKSQGSQFADVTVVLPPPDSALLTRELFYTAITRARRHLTVIGTRESIRRAIGQPTQRNSGLKRQWQRMRQGGISSSDT